MSDRIRFCCPYCQKELKAPQQFAGKRVRCTSRRCGKQIVVPEPEPIEEPEFDDLEDLDEESIDEPSVREPAEPRTFRMTKYLWCFTHSSEHQRIGTSHTWKEHYQGGAVHLECEGAWDTVTRSCPICGQGLDLLVLGGWLSCIVTGLLCLGGTIALLLFAWWVWNEVESTGWKTLWLILSLFFATCCILGAVATFVKTWQDDDDALLITFRWGEWGSHRISNGKDLNS